MTAGILKKKIEEISGIRLKGDAYIWQAFTRSSVSGTENNEIFEMYGDSILSFFVMQLVHERFGFFKTDSNINFKGENGYSLKGIPDEHHLDEIKKKLVSNKTLASQIDKWNLAQYIEMGKSDKANHVENQMKIKADLFEAIIGAIAVTYKFDSKILKTAVEKMLPIDEVFNEIIESKKQSVPFSIDNAVTVVKELSEKNIFSEPVYKFCGPEEIGYFNNGEPKWSCLCRITKIGFSEVVLSNSKKTAKKCVAYKALCKYFELPDKIAAYKWINDNCIIEKDGTYLVRKDN